MSGNLFALNGGLFAAELLNSLTEHYDPSPELFDSFAQFLQNIHDLQTTNSQQRQILALLILFQLVLLKEVGLQPVWGGCANCRASFTMDWPQVYFSGSANGLICRDCDLAFTDKIGLTRSAANVLSNLQLFDTADGKTLNEIEKILIYYFTELLHKPPKMAKYIQSI